MRKIAAIISVCLVCLSLCLCFPVKGRAISFNDKPLRYSVLQFDYIEYYYTKVPCPFNSSSQGTSREPFVFGDRLTEGYVSLPASSAYLSGYLNGLAGSSVTFYSAWQIVRMADLQQAWSYSISPGVSSMILGGADVSFCVVTLSDNAYNTDEVMAAHHTVTGSISPNAAGSVDIGNGLYNLIVDNGYDDSYVMLYDLKITLPFIMDDVTTPSIMLSAITNPYDPNLLFGQWVGDQGIVVPDAPTGSPDSSGFNLGTWLADSVSGFLKAEIFPGFSIDKIFYIILVVGLLLWFFRLIS